jgi:hypothetical protein
LQIVRPFGELLYAHIKKHGSIRAFARRAQHAPSLLSQVHKGEIPPPRDRVVQWSKMLRLEGRELDEFMDAAAVATASDWARERVDHLIARLERRVAEQHVKYSTLEKKIDEITGADSIAKP